MRPKRLRRAVAAAVLLVSTAGAESLLAQTAGTVRLPLIDSTSSPACRQISLQVKLVSDNVDDTKGRPILVVWTSGRWAEPSGRRVTELSVPLSHVKDLRNPALRYEFSYTSYWGEGNRAKTVTATEYSAVQDGESLTVGAPPVFTVATLDATRLQLDDWSGLKKMRWSLVSGPLSSGDSLSAARATHRVIRLPVLSGSVTTQARVSLECVKEGRPTKVIRWVGTERTLREPGFTLTLTGTGGCEVP